MSVTFKNGAVLAALTIVSTGQTVVAAPARFRGQALTPLAGADDPDMQACDGSNADQCVMPRFDMNSATLFYDNTCDQHSGTCPAKQDLTDFLKAIGFTKDEKPDVSTFGAFGENQEFYTSAVGGTSFTEYGLQNARVVVSPIPVENSTYQQAPSQKDFWETPAYTDPNSHKTLTLAQITLDMQDAAGGVPETAGFREGCSCLKTTATGATTPTAANPGGDACSFAIGNHIAVTLDNGKKDGFAPSDEHILNLIREGVRVNTRTGTDVSDPKAVKKASTPAYFYQFRIDRVFQMYVPLPGGPIDTYFEVNFLMDFSELMDKTCLDTPYLSFPSILTDDEKNTSCRGELWKTAMLKNLLCTDQKSDSCFGKSQPTSGINMWYQHLGFDIAQQALELGSMTSEFVNKIWDFPYLTTARGFNGHPGISRFGLCFTIGAEKDQPEWQGSNLTQAAGNQSYGSAPTDTCPNGDACFRSNGMHMLALASNGGPMVEVCPKASTRNAQYGAWLDLVQQYDGKTPLKASDFQKQLDMMVTQGATNKQVNTVFPMFMAGDAYAPTGPKQMGFSVANLQLLYAHLDHDSAFPADPTGRTAKPVVFESEDETKTQYVAFLLPYVQTHCQLNTDRNLYAGFGAWFVMYGQVSSESPGPSAHTTPTQHTTPSHHTPATHSSTTTSTTTSSVAGCKETGPFPNGCPCDHKYDCKSSYCASEKCIDPPTE